MKRFNRSTAIICMLVAGSLAGCGLIGGAFTLPGEEGVAGETQTVGGGQEGSSAAVPTPLPLQSITRLPTGLPYLPEGCVDARSVTVDDYGKTMCVGGTITFLTRQGGTYKLFFGPRGTLYMLGYDWDDRLGLRIGECAYAEGKLSRDTSVPAPVMPITPYSLKRCPSA